MYQYSIANLIRYKNFLKQIQLNNNREKNDICI